jgi:hypothetical protein
LTASSQLIGPKKGWDFTSSASPLPDPSLFAGFLCRSFVNKKYERFSKLKLQLSIKIWPRLIRKKAISKELFLYFETIHLYFKIDSNNERKITYC